MAAFFVKNSMRNRATFAPMQENPNTYSDPEKQERYDRAYLRLAKEWAKLSFCKRKQVGAIIVKDATIIADGFNGTPTGFENECEDDNGETKWYVLHAEANAILKVARSSNKGEWSYVIPYKFSMQGLLKTGVAGWNKTVGLRG